MRPLTVCHFPPAGVPDLASRSHRLSRQAKPDTSWLDLIARVTVSDAWRPRNPRTGSLRPDALKVRRAVAWTVVET